MITRQLMTSMSCAEVQADDLGGLVEFAGARDSQVMTLGEKVKSITVETP